MRPDTAPGRDGPAADPSAEAVVLARARRAARIDFAPVHRLPSTELVVLATVLSLAGSLAADALAVHVAIGLCPALAHFSHFQLWDYGTLTAIGVVVACACWPLVARVTSSPRWLFSRLAVLVTFVLWMPDLWLLLRGETPEGVVALMVMHLAIALVTYNLLVHVAPVRPLGGAPAAAGLTGAAARIVPGLATAGTVPDGSLPRLSPRTVRRAWSSMAVLVAIELFFGVATIVLVPVGRTSGVMPHRGAWMFVVHGALGVVLGLGAVAVLMASAAADRLARIGAVLGAIGVGAGLVGGLLVTVHATRLVGMGLMLLGVVVAAIGYLVPALDEFGRAERERAGLPPGFNPTRR